jgi:hypothetical protein
MNCHLPRVAGLHARALSLLALLLFSAAPLLHAAPGAHGPNGEHLDGPSTATSGAALPRLEAKSDAFELVATLHAGELSVLVDRFASNEPVLKATLEVESGGIKSKSTFHADQGDYAFDDANLLKLLRTPGQHALVFTVIAGKESDLLDGILIVAPAVDKHEHHGHGHALEYAAWAIAGLCGLGLVVGALKWRQRRRNALVR